MDGAIAVKPSASTFGPLVSWLTDGAEVPAGYYSANESDFAKYDQQQLAAINGKQLSAIEKAKEIAAAKAEVKQMQLAETQPANAAQSISVNASCTESHVTAIKSAIEQAAQVGISDLPKRIKAQLEKHGLQKLSDLTISDAESLLTAIETKTVEKFFELSLSKPVPS
jgi:hypothetical protein